MNKHIPAGGEAANAANKLNDATVEVAGTGFEGKGKAAVDGGAAHQGIAELDDDGISLPLKAPGSDDASMVGILGLVESLIWDAGVIQAVGLFVLLAKRDSEAPARVPAEELQAIASEALWKSSDHTNTHTYT
jgi:hypothetical protein